MTSSTRFAVPQGNICQVHVGQIPLSSPLEINENTSPVLPIFAESPQGLQCISCTYIHIKIMFSTIQLQPGDDFRNQYMTGWVRTVKVK